MNDDTPADPPSPTPTPFEFLGAWMEFAQKLGMRTGTAAGQAGTPEELFAGLTPALGMSRDHQEVGRQMLELSIRFQRQCMELNQQGADIGRRALQAFQKRGSGKDEETGAAAPIGAAALYDAWIDAAEEAYAATAHSEPFARLLGGLCNTLSAFKVQRGKLLEALARHLDWPGRAEIDSLHRRVMALEAASKPRPRRKRTKRGGR